jgi:methylated-DNA-[protein]-cysteine S-methyltransferase
VNHLRIETKAGSLVLLWELSEKLTEIQILPNPALRYSQWRKIGTWSALTRRPIPSAIISAADALRSYFETGTPISADALQWLDQTNCSQFQRKVYEATLLIPHGETRPYAWIAKQIRVNQGMRAVGQALRRNPFPILIPCHRVVSSKDLGGFMGTDHSDSFEVNFKQVLIDTENHYRCPSFPFLKTSFKISSNHAGVA